MSNNGDEISDVGSEERSAERVVRLERALLLERERQERQARLAELNVPIEQRFEAPEEPVGDNPFEAGRDVQFELPAALRAAAAW